MPKSLREELTESKNFVVFLARMPAESAGADAKINTDAVKAFAIPDDGNSLFLLNDDGTLRSYSSALDLYQFNGKTLDDLKKACFDLSEKFSSFRVA